MPVTRSRFLFRRRSRTDPTGAAIITDAVDSSVPDYRAVDIRIVNNGGIDIRHRRIIPESTTNPTTTGISGTEIPATVVDAAIEPNMRAPVSGIPGINPVYITPISGCPQEADFRRLGPITRHPVISIIIIICPISGDPEIPFNRTRWLRINRNDRRPDTNADDDAEHLRISPL